MRNRVWTSWPLIATVGTLLLAACDSDSPTQPPPAAEPAAIEIAPESVTLEEIGATATLEALVLDEEGEPIEGAEITWSSGDEEVATVDEEGVVTAVGEGETTITATAGEVNAEVPVTVELAGDD